MLNLLFLIWLLPLAAFAVQIFFSGRLPRRGDWLSTGAIGISLILSSVLFVRTLGVFDPHYTRLFRFPWIGIGSLRLPWGFLYDNLTAVMLMVVCIVSFLVHLFSIGYMKNDPRYGRYFAYLGVFSFSMLGLVICDNIFALYIFWELVGLSSYLLIGFWFEKKSAADAAKKAFLTTRIGDVGMFIGLLLVYAKLHTLSYREIFHAVAVGQLAGPYLTAAGILLFFGAIGKSAQFPLHVWLPDAMEGPTPVSALIHAATMVAAGVYLVGRLFLLFTPDALGFITVIGVITAVMAATIALVMTDIKKVLAYSTISQLGYMIAALGVGGYTAGLYHLMTHAFFKALLFLGSGSVIHAVHSQEMPEMGGLRKKMPITWVTFFIACLAISGIFPFSGFFSKDLILGSALARGMMDSSRMPVFILLLLGAGLTAFYMFRVLFMTFTGAPRDRHKFEHAHESPRVMTVPLIVLAVLSVGSAWGNWFPKIVERPRLASYAVLEPSGGGHAASPSAVPVEEREHGEAVQEAGAIPAAASRAMAHGEGAGGQAEAESASELETEHRAESIAMPLSLLIALSGIGLSWLTYVKGRISARAVVEKLRPLHTLFARKYYLDELYLNGLVYPCVRLARGLGLFDNRVIDGLVNGTGALARFTSWLTGIFDNRVVDGAVNGVGWSMINSGRQLRRVQTGRVQNYFLGLFAVALVLVAIHLMRGF